MELCRILRCSCFSRYPGRTLFDCCRSYPARQLRDLQMVIKSLKSVSCSETYAIFTSIFTRSQRFQFSYACTDHTFIAAIMLFLRSTACFCLLTHRVQWIRSRSHISPSGLLASTERAGKDRQSSFLGRLLKRLVGLGSGHEHQQDDSGTETP